MELCREGTKSYESSSWSTIARIWPQPFVGSSDGLYLVLNCGAYRFEDMPVDPTRPPKLFQFVQCFVHIDHLLTRGFEQLTCNP